MVQEISLLKYIGIFRFQFLKRCIYKVAAEQKARTTYDNILRFCDDPDVKDPIRFLREREIVHYQRFGEANRADCAQMKRVGKPKLAYLYFNLIFSHEARFCNYR